MGAYTGVLCKICHGAAHVHLQCKEGIVYRCSRCTVIFFPSPRTKERVFSLYEGVFYDEEAERFNMVMEGLVHFFRYLRARIVRSVTGRAEGKILDVGFSRGYTLSFLKRWGWESYGINISQKAVQHGRKIGLHVKRGELPGAKYPKNFFDAVTFWHVLEHVIEPHKYLQESARILKRGGRLIIEIPNSSSIPARLFRCNWLALDLPRHLFHFTPETLSALLTLNGFRIDKIRYFSLEHSTFSLLQSILNTMMGKNALLDSFKKQARASAARKVAYAMIAMVLLPFAFICSVLFALLKQGDIMRVYCTKA